MGNMKGGLAALALAFAWLATERPRWSGRVSFTAVADETVFGPDGAAFLLEARPELRGDALLCGEGPGYMELASAEKGLLWVAAEAGGRPGQGMLAARGTSPIARLAAFLVEVDRLNEVTAAPPAAAGPLDPGAGGHGLRLSVNLGTVRGGRFVSQAADSAVAELDLRLPPGLTVADAEGRLAALAATQGGGIALRRIKGWDPNWTPPAAAIAQAVAAAAAQVRGRPPRSVVRLPASDASRWRTLGVPAVCFGPQPTLAAGIDDHALARDVADCARIYALAAWRFLSAGIGAVSD
jgi:succinyl-diaminopimelate desuccinylase